MIDISQPRHGLILGSTALLCRLGALFEEPNPTGDVQLSYLTEGAANIVLNVHFSQSSNLYPHSDKLVLRLRKDIPSTVSTVLSKQQFEERIVPLFTFDPSLLVPAQLVEVSLNLVVGTNDVLHTIETSGQRKAPRRGTYIPSFVVEPYALVMPNLFHGHGTVIEFKPKWLAQSPSAPTGAKRCRTCALNAMRRADAGNNGSVGRGDSGFCPFDLLSDDHQTLSKALKQIWTDINSLSKFVRVFGKKVQPALRHLQRLQQEHHQVGLQDFMNPDKDFAVAMALRDCSMLIKIVHENEELDIVTIKLLDLDLKDSGGGKREKWAKMERDLINNGWYTGQQEQQIVDVPCAMAAN